MQTVLLPTDFSESARTAVRYALHLFQGRQVKFILLHNYDLPSRPIDIELAAHRGRFAEKPKQKLYREFISLFEETDHRNAEFELCVEYGDEVRTVLRYVAERQVDYVVLGLSGKFSWPGNWVDSIVRKAPCPVIVVPRNARYRKAGKMMKAVAGPVDPEEKAARLENARGFLTGTDTDLLIVPRTDRPSVHNFFRRSLARQLATRAKAPVLTIPA